MDEPKLPAVEHSCAELVAAGARVTFAAVAQHSGIARSVLYRTQTLRLVVEDFQRRGRDANTISALAAEVANQRLALEALSDIVRKHEEALRQLSKKGPSPG